MTEAVVPTSFASCRCANGLGAQPVDFSRYRIIGSGLLQLGDLPRLATVETLDEALAKAKTLPG